MAKKDLEQVQVIKERMLAAGIPEDEVERLVDPLADELQRRVCGLVWEHTTSSIPDMEGKIATLEPVAGKNIVDDIAGDNHVLIEGENLLALMAMQYTHIDEDGKGTIDVIYSDPPYNTGSVSFAYNDKFEKSEWLSMMDIRLKLARNLLKDDGTMLLSIDEKFVSYLKLLCDDIFGHSGACLMIETSAIAGPRRVPAMQGSIVKTAEYVLAYKKSNSESIAKNLTYDHIPGFDTHYSLFWDEVSGSFESFKDIIKANSLIADEFKKHGFPVSLDNLGFLVGISGTVRDWLYSTDISTHLFRKGDRASVGVTDSVSGASPFFIVGEKKYMRDRKGQVYNIFAYSDRIGQCDDYFNSYGERTVRGNLWKGFSSDGGNLNKEGGVSFKSGKKPLRLIRQLLKMVTDKGSNATVLDFFAGSGTTGHAVLDLNKEDGGHRRFILCTNNELGKEAQQEAKKKGYIPGSEEYEDLGVCHAVTYRRMQNVFPEYPGNNLYYYKVEQDMEASVLDDVTIARMASRAVFYVAMKENVFNMEKHEDYHLLYDAGTDVVVVTDPDMDMYDVEDRIVPEAFTRKHRKVYCSVYEPCVRDGVRYIPYPEEVLKVLKAVKKYIRREAE